MKNYLLGAVRPVYTTWGYWKQNQPESEALKGHLKYDEMYKVSRASAKKFLKGDWQEIKFTSPVKDVRWYQIAQWYAIKELWYKEPCNILAMGSDTLFIKPTDIFGQYNKMMMFNYTDPKSHSEFKHYFNDDIRYYPATMDPEVWSVGERLMDNWFKHEEKNWAWGQLLHNYQFWSQDVNVNEVLDPTMAWQAFGLDEDQGKIFNNCDINDAKILHFHGSRDADPRLEVMRHIATQLEVDIK